ncbi:hypothetical protein SLEP1_g40544 [Rubroshorea leprosula]|uniref:Uncharacterized protein n=1 Tax=Rubroshorea leprosula TaxID=152421 RepID=A0AAV5L538_9ROSI|nr:hypothetical protein SLEP1_g40544 [Rubroshorea leprosula]
MSLYIGPLSPRIRKDELEHVFRRFGRCNVRMKDGFGFIIFDFAPDAGKALRALQGRNICGQPLTLSWSNKQPRSFKRFASFDRSNGYGPPRGRDSMRGGGYGNRKKGLNGQRDYKMGIRMEESEERRLHSAGLLNEETDYHQVDGKECIKEEHPDYQEDLLNGGDHVEANTVYNDRWDGRLNDLSNGNGVGHDLEFDRYDPYKAYEGKDKNENHYHADSGGSSALHGSQEKIGRPLSGEETLKPPDSKKSWQTCYRCGGLGHKKRDCPYKTRPGRKLNRFRSRDDDDIDRRGREDDLERFGCSPRGKLHSNRDTRSMGQLENDRKTSGSGEHGRLIGSGSSLVGEKADRAWREDDGEKKRDRSATPIRHTAKRARRFGSSPSDCIASRSNSKSKSLKHEPHSGSHFRLRSVLSRSRSSSSLSKSHLPSHCSQSRSYKSSSKSCSSVSLSVSPDKHLPSHPKKMQLNLEGNLENSIHAESKEIMVEKGQPVEDNEKLENDELQNGFGTVNNGNVASLARVEGEVKRNEPKQKDNIENNLTTRSMHEPPNLSIPLSEKGVRTTESISPQCLRETKGCEDFDAFMRKDMAVPTNKLDTELPASFRSLDSTSMSSEEMCMVLDHYGLELPDENEKHLSVQTYFGSARLWPWEIVYYRRLKKGPISTKNYARRVAQNKEFGIVDKYIRSSSGWAELNHPEEYL